MTAFRHGNNRTLALLFIVVKNNCIYLFVNRRLIEGSFVDKKAGLFTWESDKCCSPVYPITDKVSPLELVKGIGILFRPNKSSQLNHKMQKSKDSLHPTTQSDPDSQTDPHQARNTWRSCNATLSHGRHIGFAVGRGDLVVDVWKTKNTCVRTAHTLRRDWRFHTSYGLLIYRDCITSIYLSVFLSQKMYK